MEAESERTVVVIDDDPDNCELVKAALEGNGVDRVHMITDPRTAVEAIIRARPHCVLLDLRMPQMPGEEILRELQQRSDARGIPVIVLTADSSRETCRTAFILGATDFVTKPIDLLELTHRVRNQVENTQLKRDLDALVQRRSRQVIQLDTILNAIDMFVWMVEPETGSLVYSNECASAQEAGPVWDLIGTELDLGAVEGLQQIRVSAGEGQALVAYDAIRQDVHEGAHRYVLVAAYESTERVRSRLALEAALEREEAALRRLHELEASRTRFLTATSHELRTPLTVIRGTVEVARRHLPDHQLTPMLDAAVRQARRLNDLVTDLVLVADGVAGSARSTEVPVRALVASALGRLSIDDRVRVRVETPVIDADPELIERCLLALLDNAVRFSPPGAPVLLAFDRVEGCFRIHVEDAGPGIREELRQQVFEPFVRGDAAVEHSPGTGIGLTVARLIARAHGGDIRIGASSELGGAQVEVTLLDVPAGSGRRRADPRIEAGGADAPT